MDSALFPVSIDGKWGYIDDSGELVIDAKFSRAEPFSEGLACVAVQVKFDVLTRFLSGEPALSWGYINTTGEYKIHPKFAHAGKFSNGLAPAWQTVSQTIVNITSAPGFINPDGEWALDPNKEWFNISEFSEGLAGIQLQDGWTFVNTSGEVVFKERFRSVGLFSDDLAPAQDTQGNWGFINRSGEWAIEPTFRTVSSFSEGYALVEPSVTLVGNTPLLHSYGFISRSGTYVLRPAFPFADSFGEGLAPVVLRETHETGLPPYITYINPDGEPVLRTRFFQAFRFVNGLARIVFPGIDEEIGYMNRQGDVVWPK